MKTARQKGSKGEIEVAKMLEPWWARFEPFDAEGNPVRFVRTPLSGGWGTKDTRAGFRASGDLMTTASSFPFTVEVKRREGWSWATLMAGKRCPVWGYWKQAIEQAEEMKAVPMLFFRKNREDWSVMVPRDLMLTGPVRPIDHSGPLTRIWMAREIVADCGKTIPAVMAVHAFLRASPFVWVDACRWYSGA